MKIIIRHSSPPKHFMFWVENSATNELTMKISLADDGWQ